MGRAVLQTVGGIIANGVGPADIDDNIDWLRILTQLICVVVVVALIAARLRGAASDNRASDSRAK